VIAIEFCCFQDTPERLFRMPKNNHLVMPVLSVVMKMIRTSRYDCSYQYVQKAIFLVPPVVEESYFQVQVFSSSLRPGVHTRQIDVPDALQLKPEKMPTSLTAKWRQIVEPQAPLIN